MKIHECLLGKTKLYLNNVTSFEPEKIVIKCLHHEEIVPIEK